MPANFEPVSASFWSPARGVALGGVGCAGRSACTARLAVTVDGGAHWRFLTAPDVGLFDIAGAIAVPPRASAVITLAAEYFLYRSADGGKTWKTVLFYGGGATWSSLSYVSGTVGSVVVSSGGQWLLRTTDAGLTWHQIGF